VATVRPASLALCLPMYFSGKLEPSKVSKKIWVKSRIVP